MIEADSELGAIETALQTLETGELLVLGVEAIEDALAFIEQWRAGGVRPLMAVTPGSLRPPLAGCT
jgi:hypothetical protein